MKTEHRVALILEALEGKEALQVLASRHGVTVDDLTAWRDAWLAGARAANETRAVARSRLRAVVAVVAVGAVALVSREALSASCLAPSLFASLGLKYFCADDPAFASDINDNTQQLVSLMQQKLGSTWGSPDAGASTIGISTPGATIIGSGTVGFGATTRQMLNLNGTQYGIGVQSNTTYFRSAKNFAWYVGGSHNDAELNPGGGTTSMSLDPNGILSARGFNSLNANGFTSYGLKQIDSAVTSPYAIELGRLTVDAVTPGLVVPINMAALNALCRDDDGCQYTMSMVNWQNNDGVAASRSGTLFLSQSSNGWRLEQAGNDVQGVDSNGGINELSNWDCYLTDADNSAQNSRADTTVGFGFFNCAGCTYADTQTFCRMVFRD
jgi:hypothetical protein